MRQAIARDINALGASAQGDQSASCGSAAGGITARNAVEFVATGVDLLITRSVVHAPPVDFGVKMGAL